MSRTLRGRTHGYDNLAVGSASGTERTISGAIPPAEKVGGLDNPKVGGAFPTANIADNHQAGVVTGTKEKCG